MAEKRIYKVHVRKPSNIRVLATTIAAFGMPLLILGYSRIWFGGSWVLDLFAVLFGFLIVYATTFKRLDDTVAMTPEEMRAWLDAGCPDTWPS